MQSEAKPFHSLYSHGYARVSVCVPIVKIASPEFNADAIIALAHQSNEDRAVLTVFPELGVSGYSGEDLFQQDALLAGTERALTRIARETASLQNLLLVGAPLRVEGQLFNCAIALHGGRVLGVVPKTFLPNYREYYEKRQFSSSVSGVAREIRLAGSVAPLGSDLIFEATDLPGFSLFAEICEDLWVPIPPSTWGALAGATVLANLSASNITIGKAAYRRQLCAGQSGRCVAAYLYTAAGVGESTTEVAWDGHALIYENANRLAESKRFCEHEQYIAADIDLDRLRQERMRLSSFNDSIAIYRERLEKMRRISFQLGVPKGPTPLRRHVERFPFVPHDPAQWDQRCYEAYHIQVAGLEQRLRQQHQKDGDRRLRRTRFHSRVDRLLSHRRPFEASPLAYPGLHDARLRDRNPFEGFRLAADEIAWGHRCRDRHPTELHADAQGHRPSIRARRAGARHRI